MKNRRKKNRAKIFLNILKDIGITIGILIIPTLIGGVLYHFNIENATMMVLLYTFSILMISRLTEGYFYGIGSSVASILLFNFFFTDPRFTLKVDDPTYIITFVVMALTSLLTSALTTKFKKAAEEAKIKENQSNTLCQLTNYLTDAEDATAVGRIITESIVDALKCPTSFIPFDEKGVPSHSSIFRNLDKTVVRLKIDDRKELQKRMEGLHNSFDDIDELRYYPIYGKACILGVISVPKTIGETFSNSENRMIHSIIETASLALERLRSLKAQAKSREEATQERYRSNLLRAISHDIRTPLSGIMGTSEMLMSKTNKKDARYEMANDIYKDALWLHGLVENILNLTKLQDGKMHIEKQPEAIEEVISAAIMTMEKRLPDRVINVELPNNVLIAPMNAKLISQVVINLLDNASKHTAKDKEIKVIVSNNDEFIIVQVADNGSGILPKDLPYIFQMFYTSENRIKDSKRGVGLGLAICQSIIEAHGGTIKAENRKEGGALFTFTLPLKGGKEDE